MNDTWDAPLNHHLSSHSEHDTSPFLPHGTERRKENRVFAQLSRVARIASRFAPSMAARRSRPSNDTDDAQHQELLAASDDEKYDSDEAWGIYRQKETTRQQRRGCRCSVCAAGLQCVMRLVLRVLGYSLAALGGAFVLLGAVYALVFPTPAQPPRPTANSVNSTMPARVLDLNIFMRPPGIHNNADDYKNERLLYIQEQILPFYDIIAFQEAFAFGNHRIDRLVASAVQLGFDYVASPRHGPWSLASDGGLLLLSRFPVLQSHTLEYPRGLHSDWMALKGALHLSIRLDGKRHVDVYTTHTQASYGTHGERSKQDILTRLEQFSRFRDFIRQTSSPGVPILALGDFNIDSAAHDGPISQPSVNSSRAYTMMMDVLSGNGTDGAFFGKENEWLFLAASDSDSDAGRIHWKDMLYDTFGAHPVTFGDFVQAANGSLLPAETALTHAQQLLTVQSIDQLLWANMSSSVNVSLVNVTLEKFQVNNEPFTQLSDHYGIACLLV